MPLRCVGRTGTPTAYMLNGKQYTGVAIAAPSLPGELIAFKLPRT